MEPAVLAERIRLTCCVTQRRIMQACRLQECTHAAAFCATAKSTVEMGEGLYRCPVCGQQGSIIAIDAPLTLFLSQHVGAETCRVTRGADGSWHYSRPSNRSSGIFSGQGSRRGAADGSRHAPARPAFSGSASAADRGVARARGATMSARVGGELGSGRVAGSGSSHLATVPALPVAVPQRERKAAREARRQRAARSQQLDATRAALIRRALHEDSSTGDALFLGRDRR
jgi:hypothetical protein